MGQNESKNRSKAPHRSRSSKKKSFKGESKNNAEIMQDTYCYSDSESYDKQDDVFLDELKQQKGALQEGQGIQQGWSDTDSQASKTKASVPTEEKDQISQSNDGHNCNRVRRFRDKLASKLKRVEMQYVLEIFLEKGVFNGKEYCEIKNQLHPKWMCWRLAYTLELKIRDDDLIGKTTVFDLFLECLRNPRVRRSKLAARLSQESGELCPSWCPDGKDEGILDFADGIVLTPTFLDYVLKHVHCNDQLSWWRWIPYELGVRDFSGVSLDPDSPEVEEDQRSKLKNVLYQWGSTEGFARGGLEILILCLRNHVDACEVNWKGLKKLFRSRRFSL